MCWALENIKQIFINPWISYHHIYTNPALRIFIRTLELISLPRTAPRVPRLNHLILHSMVWIWLFKEKTNSQIAFMQLTIGKHSSWYFFKLWLQFGAVYKLLRSADNETEIISVLRFCTQLTIPLIHVFLMTYCVTYAKENLICL